jgi:Na+/phosphate symporter
MTHKPNHELRSILGWTCAWLAMLSIGGGAGVGMFNHSIHIAFAVVAVGIAFLFLSAKFLKG